MTDSVTYKVIITGYQPDQGTYYVEKNLADLFKISSKQAQQLLASTPYTVKEGLSEDDAKKYKKAISKAGVKCEIEDNRYNISGLSIE